MHFLKQTYNLFSNFFKRLLKTITTIYKHNLYPNEDVVHYETNRENGDDTWNIIFYFITPLTKFKYGVIRAIVSYFMLICCIKLYMTLGYIDWLFFPVSLFLYIVSSLSIVIVRPKASKDMLILQSHLIHIPTYLT